MDCPFPAFPGAAPTTVLLTLQGCGDLSWLVMPALLPPTSGFASAASSTLNMLPSLLLLTPTPISSQLSLPTESFSNIHDEVKNPKAHFCNTQNLSFMEALSHILVWLSVYPAEALAPRGKDCVCLCVPSYF